MRTLLTMIMIASAALLATSSAHAHGSEGQDTIVNAKGSNVVSKNGGCVISKWQTGHDGECGVAPAPKHVPAPVVQKPAVQPEQDARTVYFDFNKDDLTPKAIAKLNDLLRWLSTAKGVTSATVYGYADEIGNAAYNQALSSRRAAAVEGYLASKGVVLPTNVEIVKGLGQSNSLTSCDQSQSRSARIACLAADRRVEVKFEILR